MIRMPDLPRAISLYSPISLSHRRVDKVLER